MGSPQGRSVQWDSGLMLRVWANRAGLLPVVCGLRLEYPLTHPPWCDIHALGSLNITSSRKPSLCPEHRVPQGSVQVDKDQSGTINAEVIPNYKLSSQPFPLSIISLPVFEIKGYSPIPEFWGKSWRGGVLKKKMLNFLIICKRDSRLDGRNLQLCF